MVNMFMWFADVHYIQDEFGQIILDEKPKLSWDYNFIRYYNAEKVWGLDNQDISLKQEQMNELDLFIAEKRKQTGILKLCVDKDGNYLGSIREDDSRVAEIISYSPPNPDRWLWDFNNKQWYKPYFYDAEGLLCEENNSVGHTKIKPPFFMRPFLSKWSAEHSEWVPHDPNNIWQNVVRDRLALECFVDCMTVFLTENKNNDVKNLFNSLVDVIKTNTNNEEIKNIFSDYQRTINSVYDPEINIKELQTIIHLHKQNVNNSNVYKNKLSEMEKINIFFNPIDNNDIFF